MWFGRRPKTYPSEVREVEVPNYGKVLYAQWLHPKESPKEASIKDVGYWERFVSPGDLVLDIGAHTGDTTVPMALAAGSAGHVIAFEPNPYVFEVLERNSTLNPRELMRITAYNFAATVNDGRFVFQYSDEGFCNGGFLSELQTPPRGHRQPLEIEGRNLSRFLRAEYGIDLRRLSFVKIDTEGHDRAVLQSLADVLTEYRPIVMTELYGGLAKEERLALAHSLLELGYRVRVADPATPEENWLDEDALVKMGHTDLIAIPSPGRDD